MDDFYLEHYGVKGMKWGVRRDKKKNPSVVKRNGNFIDVRGREWPASDFSKYDEQDFYYLIENSLTKNLSSVYKKPGKIDRMRAKQLGTPPKTHNALKAYSSWKKGSDEWGKYYFAKSREAGRPHHQKAEKFFSDDLKLRNEDLKKYGICTSIGEKIPSYQIDLSSGNVVYASKNTVLKAKSYGMSVDNYCRIDRLIQIASNNIDIRCYKSK